MKHLTTLLLAAGLAGSMATAQNVTVLMKDGTSHKFNADRLSELKFRDVTQEESISVTFLAPDINVYSGGNVNLAFRDGEGTVECALDLYGPTDASWLNAGTYTFTDSREPFTVDTDDRYTYLKVNGEARTITGCTVEVQYGPQVDAAGRLREQGVSVDRTYRISVTLKTDDGLAVYGSYVGELSQYTPWLDMTLNKADYNVNPQLPGQFYVIFTDPDWKCYMSLVFVAEESATTLPAGEYTFSDMTMPGTLSSACNIDFYNPYSSAKLRPGSKVAVTRDGDNYAMVMDFILDDGREAHFTFDGTIGGTPLFDVPDPEGIQFTTISPEIYGYGNVEMTLGTEDGKILVLDMYGSDGAACLEPGEYTVGASTGFHIDPGYSGYQYEEGEETLQFSLVSGKVNVAEKDGVYTLTFRIMLDDDSELVGWYEGEIEGYGTITRGAFNKAEYNDATARPAGNMYVKFDETVNWMYAAGIDFYADPSATTLPAGTYTYGGQSTAPGTFSWNSYVDIMVGSSSVNNRMAEGSTINVEENGGVYTITMNMKFESGRSAVLTYTGQISGTPLFQ